MVQYRGGRDRDLSRPSYVKKTEYGLCGEKPSLCYKNGFSCLVCEILMGYTIINDKVSVNSKMTDYFNFELPREKVAPISNLGLAHIGDAVFELMVRAWLCSQGKATARGLHKATVRYVAAPAQAAATQKLLPLLTEEEADVFRRGRNTSPHSVPQTASRGEYQAATAL